MFALTLYPLTLGKEWREACREGRVFWLAITLFVLMLAVIASGWQSHKALSLQQQQVTESERLRWLQQGDKGPHSAAHYGVYVIKPSSPLAVLEPGLTPYLGHTILLEAHKQNDAQFRPIQDAVPGQRFGELTPGFVVQILLPLLIILFGFQSLAGERDKGTLQQLWLAGASPCTLFWSKAAALLSLGLLFLAPLIVYVLLIAPAMSHHLTPFDWARAGIIALGYFVYLFIWVLLTLFISAVSNTSRLALLSLLIIWGALCLLIPKIAIEWSTQSVQLDSARLFQSRMESEIYTQKRLSAIEQYKQETLRQYQVKEVSELPFDWSGAQLQFGEAYGNQVFDRLYGERQQAINQQSSRYEWAGLFSPMVTLQRITTAAAATDMRHHQWFSEAAERHRRHMQVLLNGDVKQNAQSADGDYKAGIALWKQVPEFNYALPDFLPLIPFYRKPLLLLCLWLVLGLIAGQWAVKHLSREQI